MRAAILFAILAMLIPCARADERQAESDLLGAAGLGSEAKASFGISPDAMIVAGVVLGSDIGKLLVLRRLASGQYAEEATSPEFPNDFGLRHYVEIVQLTGPERFTVQVNSHALCGVQVERYRIARSGGSWKVAGYDRREPDTQTCDVNLISRDYSANLLTGQVLITEFVGGKPTKKQSRRSKVVAPELKGFNFSMFENEP
jgi:hypothetical protein